MNHSIMVKHGNDESNQEKYESKYEKIVEIFNHMVKIVSISILI
jgi:hypothetical protein